MRGPGLQRSHAAVAHCRGADRGAAPGPGVSMHLTDLLQNPKDPWSKSALKSMPKDPERSKHRSSNKTIQECSSFHLQDRLNDIVVGPEQQELHLDEDFISALLMRARWGLEQLQVCPQTPLHSCPWQAALGYLPVLHTATQLTRWLLFSHCKFSSSSLERASSNVCLTDSFLPGKDDWKSELTCYLSGLWLSSCDSHITVSISFGFRPFSNFSPQYCKDTLSMTLFRKFSSVFILVHFSLSAECLHCMLLLHPKHTAWAPSYLYIHERILLMYYSAFPLLPCFPGQSGLHCKHQTVAETNCCFYWVYFPADILFSFLRSWSCLKTVIHQTCLPHQLKKRLQKRVSWKQIKPVALPELLVGCVKYISEQSSWTIPCWNSLLWLFEHSANALLNPQDGLQCAWRAEAHYRKIGCWILNLFCCLCSTTSCMPFSLAVYHSLHMLR